MSSKDSLRQVRRSSAGRIHSATREEILRLIESQTEGVSLNWISQKTGLHENTVRAHLEALHADGYLNRRPAPAQGKGRPAWLWTAVRQVQSPFVQLASALAGEIAATAKDPASVSIAAGRRWADSIARAQHMPTSPDLIQLSLDELGFSPENNPADGSLTLHSCPLLGAVAENQQIVCNVHLGMVRGLVESQGQDASDVQLNPFAGANRSCILHLKKSQNSNR